MNIICKIFGHSLIKHKPFIGISPSKMVYIERTATYCMRYCNYKVFKDVEISKYNVKQDRLSINSGGPCYMCVKSDTCNYKKLLKNEAYVYCPIVEFEFKEGYKHYFDNFGDTLIS